MTYIRIIHTNVGECQFVVETPRLKITKELQTVIKGEKLAFILRFGENGAKKQIILPREFLLNSLIEISDTIENKVTDRPLNAKIIPFNSDVKRRKIGG
jgi:hypothetical protein